MNKNKPIITERIKSLRTENGYTQEQLAEILGLNSKSSIANYESGANSPSDEIKLKMCDIFDCSIDYLLGKTDVRNPGQKIDDVLNEAMIGMSKKDYDELTDTQKKQIRDFAIFVKEQKLKGEN